MVKAEIETLSFPEMLRKADDLGVHPDDLSDTMLQNYRRLIGGVS